MTYQPATISDDRNTVPQLPGWVTSARPETPEDVAFLSGVALGHLHLVLTHENVPQTLLRARLALRAAEACVTLSGRPERAAELRDAVAFLQPGDSPGPAGDIYLSWQRAVERPVSMKALERALPDLVPDQIGRWLDAGQGAPIHRAAAVFQAVIGERPRDHTASLLLADAALAQVLGWTHALPLLALGLKRGDLRKTGEELRLACHRAILAAAAEASREAADLARRAERLRAVAPKLRAKGADEALALFLTRDAVAPATLTSLRSDRAARRFCDRLLELGAVRELTGRDTFRLYGV
ncbi:DUF1403 family protein [Roseobacter sp. HKCCD9010]|uniref:DUF1403 family protein n=1 Tax=unclassified Roseobacter TaxID=196798 RepID=UPI0014930B78|nr:MULTISPECIES: DUF1403 family protein [unclassified Roseobacter]MBF9052324.1 DUF1403 family protein [Rhodobacterales bacterium HKCCD4356]NNV14327.1 DUF1403 family protein [Roseobacter sp. HKCCD7357]NNV18507.1 DUF1403 family protein [Roseobacter sp. HKCCD8768]NNV28204.1 DUF1403 family protein [Roseobacter sp. HKCCD8192]NNV32532.1 DUF1403 family protein [Roseobacter sp. HKCCD9061]